MIIQRSTTTCNHRSPQPTGTCRSSRCRCSTVWRHSNHQHRVRHCLHNVRAWGDFGGLGICDCLVVGLWRHNLICCMLFLLWTGDIFYCRKFVTWVLWHLNAGDGCGAGAAVFSFPPAPEFVHRVVADQVACLKCPEFWNRSLFVP